MATLALWCHQPSDPGPRPVRQNASVGGTTPPAPETNQMILRKLLQSLSGEKTVKRYPRSRSVVLRVCLTRGCCGDMLWQCDTLTISGTWSRQTFWSALKSAPQTLRREVVITINADYRLELSQTFSCYETHTKPWVWCCIKHLFVYRFNDWLLTGFRCFAHFLKFPTSWYRPIVSIMGVFVLTTFEVNSLMSGNWRD